MLLMSDKLITYRRKTTGIVCIILNKPRIVLILSDIFIIVSMIWDNFVIEKYVYLNNVMKHK